MLEKDIEKKLVAWCLTKGWECLKLRLDGQNGFPDRTIIAPHGICFIELKRPGGKLRARQRVWLDKLNSMGHLAFCSDSLNDMKGRLTTWAS